VLVRVLEGDEYVDVVLDTSLRGTRGSRGLHDGFEVSSDPWTRFVRKECVSRGVGATVVLAGVLLAACSGCGGGRETGSSRSGEVAATTVGAAEVARRMTRNGISIGIPAGWDGRMLFRDSTGSWGVILQVANFELPSNEGFRPSEELPPGQEDPIKAMDARDVLITIVSGEAAGEPAPEPITFGQLRLLPEGAPRVPRGHTLAEGSFCYGAHCLRIGVDFGGRPQPDLKSSVSRVLASLDVERRAGRREQRSSGD
jgi:hypothetical protein